MNPWPIWDHPVFPRPVYEWNWPQLIAVTCTAEDSNGYEYPVTENDFVGIEYQTELTEIEDQALDWCYDATNGDASCMLVGCTPDYEVVP